LFSNRLMLLWGFVVGVTLLVGTNVLFVHESLRITSLSLINWVIVVVVSFVATFWMELKKILGL
jgi:hypothetical protein